MGKQPIEYDDECNAKGTQWALEERGLYMNLEAVSVGWMLKWGVRGEAAEV